MLGVGLLVVLSAHPPPLALRPSPERYLIAFGVRLLVDISPDVNPPVREGDASTRLHLNRGVVIKAPVAELLKQAEPRQVICQGYSWAVFVVVIVKGVNPPPMITAEDFTVTPIGYRVIAKLQWLTFSCIYRY